MKPLSGDDSQRLFYKRIFSHESGCPPEFEVLSKDILKKCGGVPLAIISIASLLTSDLVGNRSLALDPTTDRQIGMPGRDRGQENFDSNTAL
jgi:hypothetical protein